jgi:hypothetical protein
VLAKDIDARHQQALTAVREWNRGWGPAVSGILDALENAEYIRKFQKVMPMRHVRDPELQNKYRRHEAKQASRNRKRG